jgi:hypothetical protein
MKINNWDIQGKEEILKDESIYVSLFCCMENKLRNKGLERIANGKIKIVNRKSRNKKVLGSYNPKKDLITLSTLSRHNITKEYVLLHEIGYRYFKKIKNKTTIESINDKYQSMANYVNLCLGDINIMESDMIIDKLTGKEYKIISEEAILDKNGNVYELTEDMVKTDMYIGEDDFCKEGRSYFPTIYSLTNKNKFFAELFAYWIMDKLSEPAKSWFEGLIRQNEKELANEI